MIDLLNYEPHHEKACFLHMQKHAQVSWVVTMQLICAFVFATQIVQSLYSLNLMS